MDYPGPTDPFRASLARWIGPALVLVGLLWFAWPSLVEMVARWSSDPRYSHGYLVPAFAGFLLWSRRGILNTSDLTPSTWGLAPIAGAMLLGLLGARYYLTWFDALALLPALAGLALLTGGRPALRWAWPAIGFLVFMIPLPYRIETALGAPLQRTATLASTYALQTLGLPAIAEGNIILIDEARIGVVEACNGLGMLLMFFAFAMGVVLVTRRGVWEAGAILLSAAPIALLANVTRITATGILHRLASTKSADAFYHDLAGWLMMPLALVAFGLELWLLSHLLLDPPPRDPALVGFVPGLDRGALARPEVRKASSPAASSSSTPKRGPR